MQYTSTRDSKINVSASQAIAKGLAPNGGLFVPTQFPKCTYEDVKNLTYPQMAQKIIGMYLTEYDENFLKETMEKVYAENFDGKAGFVKHVKNNEYALELYHGPTCAFKDYALQVMPHLLVQAKKNIGDTHTTKILVATSGDTGKAALDGYADLEGIKIAVFYPNDGTSEIQRLQMVTQEGENVSVYAINGNFDDAQTGVKKVFTDEKIAATLEGENACLSSANSINWGRLVPQIVYYFYSYASLVESGAVKAGEKVNFCVPTGNFGDILAGYYAKQMGLPVGELICASNKNNVLTDFFKTGVYNAKRDFYKTTSPSMDILVSSNLERLLYHISNDAECVNALMQDLAQKGEFKISEEMLDKISGVFKADFASDEEAEQIIADYAQDSNYVMDPHTAVAFSVANKLDIDKNTNIIVLSTASPYKFSHDVLTALGKVPTQKAFEDLNMLNDITKLPVPKNLAGLEGKEIRFEKVIEPDEIKNIALQM